MSEKQIYIGAIEAQDRAKVILKNVKITQIEKLCQDERFLEALAEAVVKELSKRHGKFLYDKFDQQCKDFVQSKESQLVTLPENCSTNDVISVFGDPHVKRNALYGYIALLILSIVAFIFVLAEVIIHLNSGVNIAERLRFYLLIVGIPSIGSLLCLLFAWIIAKVFAKKRTRFRAPCVVVAFFVIIGIVSSFFVKPYEVVDGKIEYVENNDGYTALLLQTESQGKVTYTIPIDYKGKKITEIGRKDPGTPIQIDEINIDAAITTIQANTFAHCYGYKDTNGQQNELVIKIPDSVKEIGTQAFYRCENLVGITLSNNLTSIADNTFAYCANLKEIVIPDSVSAIGKSVFLGCEKLASIQFGNNLRLIGDYAFADCLQLTNMEIPNTVTSLGQSAFLGCSNLETLSVPFVGANVDPVENTHFGYIFGAKTYYENSNFVLNSLKSVTVMGGTIAEYAFYGCENLVDIQIGENVTNIGFAAFENCNKLETISVPFIGENADGTGYTHFGFIFGSANKLDQTFPASLKNVEITNAKLIDDYAFMWCIDLENIILEGTLTEIASYAFGGCNSLSYISLPSTITKIDESAFVNCTNLKAVDISSLSDWCKIDFGNTYANPMYYADNLLLNGENIFGQIELPDGISVIPDYTFKNSAIETISIPFSVTNIGNNAFYHCTSLYRVYITDLAAWCNINFDNSYANPMYYAKYLHLNRLLLRGTIVLEEGIEAIPDYTFKNSLVNGIIIPASVERLGYIGDAQNLETLIFKDGSKITSINAYAFSNFQNLKTVTFESNSMLISIGNNAFEECENLAEITVPANVTSIGDYAFYNCKNLKNVIFENNSQLANIGRAAFQATSIQELVLDSKLEDIKPEAFASCNNLQNIELTDSDQLKIGYLAFAFCNSLEKISMSCIEIEYSAFLQCVKLNDVYYKGDLASWCNITFAGEYANPLNNGAILHIGNNILTEFTFPEHIIEIKQYAFYGCTSITKLTVPVTVAEIGIKAFDNCGNLKSVIIPKRLANSDTELKNIFGINYQTIDFQFTYEEEFEIDGSILIGYIGDSEDVVVPDGIVQINGSAFRNMGFIESLTLPASVVNIGSGAFQGCNGLIKVNYLGEISDWCGIAFGNASSNPLYMTHNLYMNDQHITNLIIPNNVTVVSAYAFINANFASVIIGENVTDIGTQAFSYNTIKSITIPQNVANMGSNVFSNCGDLATITWNATACLTGSGLFSNCYITTIHISENVISFPQNAFGDMLPDIGDDYFSSYRNVYYEGDLTGWCNIDFASIESNPLQFGSLYIKGVLVSQLNFSNAVTEIKAFAFARCRSLTSIMFPQTITNIGGEAFVACTNIKSLDIPKNIESIGLGAFSYCHSLLEVKVDAKTIDGGVFGACMALTQVTIGKDVTSMGTQVFYGCESLERAIFEEPSGWKIKGYYDNAWSDLSASDLQNSELAATYLKSPSYYEFYYWQRS